MDMGKKKNAKKNTSIDQSHGRFPLKPRKNTILFLHLSKKFLPAESVSHLNMSIIISLRVFCSPSFLPHTSSRIVFSRRFHGFVAASPASMKREELSSRNWKLVKLLKYVERSDSEEELFKNEEEMIAVYRAVPETVWRSMVKGLCKWGDYASATRLVKWLEKHMLLKSSQTQISSPEGTNLLKKSNDEREKSTLLRTAFRFSKLNQSHRI